MNHYWLGILIIVLGMTYFCAGYFKLRYWMFGRGERWVLEKYGEEKVFKTRKVKGLFGVILGIIIMLFGNF